MRQYLACVRHQHTKPIIFRRCQLHFASGHRHYSPRQIHHEVIVGKDRLHARLTRAPQATKAKAPSAQSTPKAETPSASSTDRTVKGTTTFVNLLGWGVSQATIEKVLGASMPTAQVTKIKGRLLPSFKEVKVRQLMLGQTAENLKIRVLHNWK